MSDQNNDTVAEKPATQFIDFALDERILKTLIASGYEKPSPIQVQAIPLALQGRDIMGIAQTGTGKTAAFALPSITHLAAKNVNKHRWMVRMLVLAPTRELASQIAMNMTTYSKGMGIFVTTAFGGVPIKRQQRALEKGVDVLVATPGRLLDLQEQRSLDLSSLEILVLDEADQMMDMGFAVPLKKIVGLLPQKRQSLFFSATMPGTIQDLARLYLKDPVRVEVSPASTPAKSVEQRVYYPDGADKTRLMRHVLAQETDIDRVLVFTRTKHGADRLAKYLAQENYSVAAIHGNRSQPQRELALKGFRSGKVQILVATDIAARGLDVSGVSHVINYELPNVAEQYIHRIGRTGRADATGIAISLCGPEERQWMRSIEKLIGRQLEAEKLPMGFDKPDPAELPPPQMGGGRKPQKFSARPSGKPGGKRPGGGPRGAKPGARPGGKPGGGGRPSGGRPGGAGKPRSGGQRGG